MSSGWVGLAIVGLLMSVVSAYYYLRVVVAMYMHEPGDVDNWATVSTSASVALVISAAVTLGLGIYPAPVLSLARLAARSLL